MKQFILPFLSVVLIGCTSNKRVNDSPLANGTDTVMVSKGYDEVELFKTRTGHIFQINGYDIEEKDLYLMDISYINSEFRKNHARQVDGVLGTDFLDKYGAVIDYTQQRLYLRIRKQD